MKKIYFLFCYFTKMIVCYNPEVEYYENIILKSIDLSTDTNYFKDSSMYSPSSSAQKMFGSFDFIIIGAGSTGTVIANRLSKVKEWRILVLEAGTFGNNITDIPNMEQSIRLSDYNWGFKSIPQTTSCLDMKDRICLYPQGKGVGGSSLLNGLVYSRGNKFDFDKWGQNNPGWSYDEVLPYFKISENFRKTDPGAVVDFEQHGSEGEVNVEYLVPRLPLTNVWLESNKELGFNITDYNGYNQLGASIPQVTTNHGRRADGGNSFIKPIRKSRKNLEVMTESFVTKIVISKTNKKATGVLFVHKGVLYYARNLKEVIVSAGSISSPQLLMLSGIGPYNHLQQLGIEEIQNLEVGSRLQDHPTFVGLSFSSNASKPQKPLKEYIEEYLHGTGSLTYPNSISGIGFYKSNYAQGSYPDIELTMFSNDEFLGFLKTQLSEAKEKMWLHLNDFHSFVIYATALQSTSHGTLRLKSKNPFEYPLIDSRLLTDSRNRDIKTLYEGIQLILKLIGTESFAKINATLVKQNIPACNKLPYLSRKYWLCTLRHFTTTGHRPTGTCRMGPNPKKGDVVDAQCRIHGIQNIRVADASIIPVSISGRLNAVCGVIGEIVSTFIKSYYL